MIYGYSNKSKTNSVSNLTYLLTNEKCNNTLIVCVTNDNLVVAASSLLMLIIPYYEKKKLCHLQINSIMKMYKLNWSFIISDSRTKFSKREDKI